MNVKKEGKKKERERRSQNIRYDVEKNINRQS